MALAWPSCCQAANVITQVTVSPTGQGATISVVGSEQRPAELNSFALGDPPRLVFDLPGASLPPGHEDALPLAAAGLRQIRVGQYQADPPVMRLVADLEAGEPTPTWQAIPGQRPNELLIVFRGGGPAALAMPGVKVMPDGFMLRFAGVGHLQREVGALGDPPRLFVDLWNSELGASQENDFPEGAIRQIRMAQQPARDGLPVARFVIELRQPLARIVFRDGDDLLVALGERPWALPLPEYQGQSRLRGKRVVVDPGHGGKKPGSLGADPATGEKLPEKDITLDIGRRLGRLLAAESAEVAMTREGDVHVTLAQRSDLANRLKADLFVSVHCNSCKDPNTLQGTMVFFDHPHSARLAQLTHDELISALGTEDKGVRNANFDVIRKTEMPGILVEVAFINHDGDRERLLNANFRERSARAILQGVIRFFAESLPSGAPAQ